MFPTVESQVIGSSLKFCLVAQDSVNVNPRLSPTCIWETLAEHALLLAANSSTTQIDGSELIKSEPCYVRNPQFVVWGPFG